jgi:hypothetical protein
MMSVIWMSDEAIENEDSVGMLRQRSSFDHATVDMPNSENERTVIGDKLMDDIIQQVKGWLMMSGEERI